MSNELQVFTHPEFGDIRTVTIDGKPHAVGVDVARALEYANPSKALIDHCRGDFLTWEVTDALGREQKTRVIPEGDIFRLIVKAAEQSRNPEIKAKAEKFERWVFDEVLPSIRKHGAYMTPQTLADALRDPASLIQVLTVLQEEQERGRALAETVSAQRRRIVEMEPKASYYDLVLACKDALSINVIAKDYGKSARWLNKWLHEQGVQYKQGDIWLLRQQYAGMEYTCTRTHPYVGKDGGPHSKSHTYWTQRGRLFIYNALKAAGVLPTMERAVAGAGEEQAAA